jgi:hypothetical protein
MEPYFDLGTYTRGTSTASTSAQTWFDRGLVWGYAFHHEDVGFGFRRFAHYRIRVLLYAGRPDWTLLATVTPR